MIVPALTLMAPFNHGHPFVVEAVMNHTRRTVMPSGFTMETVLLKNKRNARHGFNVRYYRQPYGIHTACRQSPCYQKMAIKK